MSLHIVYMSIYNIPRYRVNCIPFLLIHLKSTGQECILIQYSIVKFIINRHAKNRLRSLESIVSQPLRPECPACPKVYPCIHAIHTSRFKCLIGKRNTDYSNRCIVWTLPQEGCRIQCSQSSQWRQNVRTSTQSQCFCRKLQVYKGLFPQGTRSLSRMH